MKRLQAESLSLSYDGKAVIEQLDLQVPPGCMTALVGPNGCGKSTLLRGLARLLKPYGGAVYLDGKALQSLKTKEIAKQVGILPQGQTAPEGLTVYELVAQGRYPHQGWLQQWSDADEAATRAALAITGLTTLADRPLETLSGGQRQRAWIAMALAQETEILLLDEPTTYLDVAYQLDVLDLLHDLNEQGRTIVMVLHDLNQACRYADHLVAMRQGRIVAQGAPQAILTAELVQQVFQIACQVIADPITGAPMCVPIGRKHKRAVGANGRDLTPAPIGRSVPMPMVGATRVGAGPLGAS
ncbi:MAG TPA: ABC transporter ATP-binding protein [Caldilineaceae bacterium]|nr:ABC transporter ATP-binding protein [Caldilineaceae bacterium]